MQNSNIKQIKGINLNNKSEFKQLSVNLKANKKNAENYNNSVNS